MTHPFESSREKIEWAKQHIHDLEIEVRSFLDSKPYLIVAEEEPETGDKIYRVRVRAQPPLRWGARIGDVLHNLRSSLDHIAYILVENGGGFPDTNTGFPIAKNRKAFESILGKVSGAGKKSIRVLRAQKPYGGGNDLLWWLHHLNIVDKHRFPLLAGAAYRNFILNFEKSFRRSGVDLGVDLPDNLEFPSIALRPKHRLFLLEDGDPVFRIMKAARHEDDDDEPQFTFEIAFGEPEVVNGEPLLDTLNAMASEVEGVLQSFITLYESEGPPRTR